MYVYKSHRTEFYDTKTYSSIGTVSCWFIILLYPMSNKGYVTDNIFWVIWLDKDNMHFKKDSSVIEVSYKMIIFWP